MRIIITILLLLFYFQNNAQTSSSTDSTKSRLSATDSICLHPEVEAKFKKGSWSDFLLRNMTYPKEAKNQEIQGTVAVEFIIETDGSITNVKAIFGPKELRDNAENLVKKSPKWTAAINKGKAVRTKQTQPIIYRLP